MNSFSSRLALLLYILCIYQLSTSCTVATQPSQSYTPAPQSISDNDTVAGFLMDIDFGVNAMADDYPQLADWNLLKQGTAWRTPGKIIWDNHLFYNHALDQNKTVDNYLKLYKKNGFTLMIHVYTPKEFRYVNMSGLKNQIFGEKMGRFSIIASVISENPNDPEFDQLMLDLIKRTMIKWGHIE